jgi:hypothetical protein
VQYAKKLMSIDMTTVEYVVTDGLNMRVCVKLTEEEARRVAEKSSGLFSSRF